MKRFILLILLFFIYDLILCQEEYNIFPKVLTPSPNAAAISNFGNIPVGYYNGLPNISIPIYTIQSRDIKLPITLNYNAKGIKVSQEASWVGLGWSLNVGGVITRKVNGLDDFKSTNGYIFAMPVPDYANEDILPNYHYMITTYIFASSTYEVLDHYYNGSVDGQPDNFYFNFLNNSGELFFTKQQPCNIITANTVDQNNLKFSYDLTSEEWEVTDEKGWKYYFGTKETSRYLSSISDSFVEMPAGTQSEDIITAWYLDRIIAIGGDEIDLTYTTSGNWIESQPTYNEMQVNDHIWSFNVNETPGYINTKVQGTKYYASIEYVNEVYLDRINFNDGYVLFSKTDRLDRKYSQDASPSQKLHHIEISSLNESFKKYFLFDYGYFRDDSINAPHKEKYLRLKLNKVTEAYNLGSSPSMCLNPYIFEYSEETALPAKTSFAVDQWGYYNGEYSNIQDYKFVSINPIMMWDDNPIIINENESTVIPTLLGRFINFDIKKVFIYGRDKNPNPLYINSASLKSINYPTKGLTEFELEPNDYYQEGVKDDVIFTAEVGSPGTHAREITIDQPGAFVLLTFHLENMENCSIHDDDMDVSLSVKDNENNWHKFIKFFPANNEEPIDEMDSHICVALDAGTYQLKCTYSENAQYLLLSLKATFFTQQSTGHKYGDGLRIKSIKNFDNEGGKLLSHTVFDYTEDGHSSGKIMNQFEPIYNETALQIASRWGYPSPYPDPCCLIGSIGTIDYTDGNYIIIWASGVKPISFSARGNNIGYSKVSVTNNDQNEETNGKTVYQYINVPDEEYGTFMPNSPGMKNLQNGLLTNISYFNNTNLKVRSTTFEYLSDYSTESKIRGVTCIKPIQQMDICNLEECPPGIIARYYSIVSQWWGKKSEVDTTFDSPGSNSGLIIKRNYYYENPDHKLLTQEITNQSDGKEIKKTYKYPLDISDPSEVYTDQSVINKLNSDHQIDFLIKSETYVDNILMNGQINSPILNPETNTIVVGAVWKLDNITYDKKEVLNYSIFNRLVQETLIHGIPTTLIWGYNYGSPIAKIENAYYLNVINELGSIGYQINTLQDKSETELRDIFRTLRDRPNMKEILINSFTYKPLLGMNSATDQNNITTYYEYDDFGRMSIIRDNDLNILKHFDYNFAQCISDISPEAYHFDPAGGSVNISFNSMDIWIANESEDFLEISPTQGNGNGTINVICLENTTSLNRSGLINISCGDFNKIVSITQARSHYLQITPYEDIEFPKYGGSATFTVDTDVEWGVGITMGSNFLSIGTLTETSFEIIYTDNNTGDLRVGKIRITGEGVEDVIIIVYQRYLPE
jgi:YD repeat-containing protein